MARDGKYSIILEWYNTLGGIETFNFTARKSYGYRIGKTQTSERDVFNDWDNDFASATIETDTLSIDASERVTVRSQNLTEQQINAIAQIRISPRVTDLTNNVSVQVDRKSLDYRTDHEKRHLIEFVIVYPKLIIPSL